MIDLPPLKFIQSGKVIVFLCDHEFRSFCNGSCQLFKWDIKAKINHDKREYWKNKDKLSPQDKKHKLKKAL